jgi:hypothetical protein
MRYPHSTWQRCRQLLAQEQFAELFSLLTEELARVGHPAREKVARLRAEWDRWRADVKAKAVTEAAAKERKVRLVRELSGLLDQLQREEESAGETMVPPSAEPADLDTRGVSDNDWFGSGGEEATRGGDVFGGDPFAGEESATEPEAFKAYPHISDPGAVAQGAKFEISVGFRADLDETLEGVQQVVIEKPKEVDFVDVLVVAVGARMEQTGMQKLFLNLNSQIRVSGTVLPQANEVLLTVLYFYSGQPVGQGTRRIAVAGQQPATSEPGMPAEPLAVGREMEPVDLVATATYSAPDQLLSWRIVAGGQEVGEAAEVELAAGRQFAGQLMSSLAAESFAGRAAWNTLQGLGTRVGQLYPPAFYRALRELADRLDRPPRVLLLTNEFYVPWELAFHPELQLDENYPPFLNLQTEIGRWLISAGIKRQPTDRLPFDQFGVVAADYPFDSDQVPLEEALAEKQALIDRFQAVAIEAKREDLMELADAPPAVGRILHLALHGYSRPDLNEQSIALEDGSLAAEGWLPVPFGKQKPVLSFVFLNACQVGTAGSHLSQAGGFPGALFQRGLLGFIAPLWDVHDVKARAFSEGFYQHVLTGKEPVGETILGLRRKLNYKESLTEMAYVYYGHPGMRLELAAAQPE